MRYLKTLLSEMVALRNTNNNIVHSCKYHVVWCPKYSKKVLVGELEVRLKELIMVICEELQVKLIELEIMPDHVHIFIDVNPQLCINKVIKTIKGKTSRKLRKEFKELTPTLWTNSYFISAFGRSPSTIKQYIIDQKSL